MLELDNIYVAYGSILALRGVSLRVAPGELVALIGSNGAGKTTTLRTISGLLRARQGAIRYRGEEIAIARRLLQGPLHRGRRDDRARGPVRR
ncbi:MAG: ATP-binding cassette domain-containing protein [Chloroflexales bacterium]|nr:ATP-binding cassette domain-containing protein [Chloroflexales bacterium]